MLTLCLILFRNENCFPPPNRYFALCSVSIHAMSEFNPLEKDIQAVAGYVRVCIYFIFLYLKFNCF